MESSTSEIIGRGTLVETPETGLCRVCGTPTSFKEIRLGVPLCPGACTTSERVSAWIKLARREWGGR